MAPRPAVVARAMPTGSEPERLPPSQQEFYTARLGKGNRLRPAGQQVWRQLFPQQTHAAIDAYKNKTLYPEVELWVPHQGGDGGGWAPLRLTLMHDTMLKRPQDRQAKPEDYALILVCPPDKAAALGLSLGDSLVLMALQRPAPGGGDDVVMVLQVATCNPAGDLTAGGAPGADLVATTAAALAAHMSAPPPGPPPTFTATYSVDLERQHLEVALPPPPTPPLGGSAAAASDPAEQETKMRLSCVRLQPRSKPDAKKPRPVEARAKTWPVTWQPQRGSSGGGGPATSGVEGGAMLRGLPPTLLQELPPQGRLLVLPQQGLVVLVDAQPAASVASTPAAVGAAEGLQLPVPVRRRRSRQALAPVLRSDSSDEADAPLQAWTGPIAGSSNPAGPSIARPTAPPPLTSPPPLLVHFTVSSSGPDQGPGEGGSAGAGAGDGSADEAGQLLQLVADEGMSDWASLQEAWGLPPAQRDWQRPLQEVEVLLPQLLALGAGPADRLQWARVPMWLLPSASGEGSGGGSGSGSSSPVLCCRRATAAALGLQPGDRVALHPAGPGCVVLVTGPAAGAGQGPPLDTASGIQVASALTGREPILLTWTKKLRVKINLSSEGRSDWTPLFPAEAPLARGDGGQPQQVLLWAPPQLLAPEPTAALDPTSAQPLHFSLALNSLQKSKIYMQLGYQVRKSGGMVPKPDDGVMAVLPGSRLVVAWWWPGAAAAAADGGEDGVGAFTDTGVRRRSRSALDDAGSGASGETGGDWSKSTRTAAAAPAQAEAGGDVGGGMLAEEAPRAVDDEGEEGEEGPVQGSTDGGASTSAEKPEGWRKWFKRIFPW
ncbi:hypothetical protein HYH02_014811 [Chlamydomonas schloesseri]|uniref:Uncharacterized protein n=1 Tax=Chlamydomonas schloesseri TaxID=2026947 RepID=A0A835SFQ4_9CHLO|nr:hypothetical protein HYH02_014811 [Chlamydomonas schloesseri]|eukprot:KAG2426383.1 hypothetical protein HYH02_014811 [Chlamydomonas schloesseri]